MTKSISIKDIDPAETFEHIYRCGSYEDRRTGTRYKLVVDGYANFCKNQWTVDIRGPKDLLDPKAAAQEIVIDEDDGLPPHRSMTRVRVWDCKDRAFLSVSA